MKYLKVIFIFLLAIPFALWSRLTRRAYYLTGTFIDNNGKRMFFKTTFVTYRNIFPIQSLEKNIANGFGVDKIIILFFHRIPWGMLKYVEEDYDEKIDFQYKPN